MVVYYLIPRPLPKLALLIVCYQVAFRFRTVPVKLLIILAVSLRRFHVGNHNQGHERTHEQRQKEERAPKKNILEPARQDFRYHSTACRRLNGPVVVITIIQ
jgi:hypothetical protein